jgi:predicted transcriptional regulator
MDLITKELTGKSVEEMTTEIRFFIASCKVKSIDVFKLNIKKIFKEEREEKRIASVSRILYTVKREGLIQLYIQTNDLKDDSTEAAYINNKYPEIRECCTENEDFIIKL